MTNVQANEFIQQLGKISQKKLKLSHLPSSVVMVPSYYEIDPQGEIISNRFTELVHTYYLFEIHRNSNDLF